MDRIGNNIIRRVTLKAIRTSAGATLHLAARLGGKLLTIQSDPQAEGFYRSMGAQPTGKRETGSIPGRQLPALTMCLEISDIA
jgi:hypothetical protein